MSNSPTAFYRIHGSYKTVCLLPLPAGAGVSQATDGSYYYEYEDRDEAGEYLHKETVYPSKKQAWEKVLADIREEIAERERMITEVSLAWHNEADVAKVQL